MTGPAAEATAAESVSALLSLALPARNIALAEKMDGDKDILVPCSACYLNLKKVEIKAKNDPELKIKLNEVLKENQLELRGKVHVRHLLDIMSKDLGPKIIQNRPKKIPLRSSYRALLRMPVPSSLCNL